MLSIVAPRIVAASRAEDMFKCESVTSFHPDKNHAPGAGEAFKAIGNAFAVLSDPEKKRQYDLYGPMDSQPTGGCRSRRTRQGFYENDPTHGFESDMTAEEIFNMFFGGGESIQTFKVLVKN